MKKLVIGLAVFVFAFSAAMSVAQSRKFAAKMMQQNLLDSKERLETNPTLEPSLFSKNYYAQVTYKIAKEIPAVLDKVFCYCYCAINPKFKHKSLLTCYVGNHASECGVCMKEAISAKQMTEAGKTPKEIAQAMQDQYLNKKHNH